MAESSKTSGEAQSNANLMLATRLHVLESVQSSSITVEIVDAADFEQFAENSALSVHIRAGSGRSSSNSVPACKNPQFRGQRFQIIVADELLNLQQLWHLLQYTPLSIFTVTRRVDGVSAVHGIGQADLGEFIEHILEGNQYFEKEIQLRALGSQEQAVGSVVLKVGFTGVQNIETLPKDKGESLLSQIVAFRGS